MSEYTASQKKKYLAQVLRMNPVHQADRIIQLRNGLLGKTSSEAANIADQSRLTKLRERATQQIDEIRAQMWRQHPQRLFDALKTVNVRELPEMKGAVDRLRMVIQNHSIIQQLSQHKAHHINLTNTFKRVIMLSPRDAGALKESYLRQIAVSPDLKQIKKAVGVLQREFPQLYEMESDWFAQIGNIKGRIVSNANAQTPRESYSDDESMNLGWLIWIVFIVIARIIAVAIRNSSS